MHAIFLRAVNVGGNKVKTRQLADELGLINLGAAGTFVAKMGAPATWVKKIQAALAFQTDIIVVDGDAIVRLVRSDPFASQDMPDGVKASVTVLAHKLATPPALPLVKPVGDKWEVDVFDLVDDVFALSRRRRLGDRLIYPNEVVEKAWKVGATTRGWDTIVELRDLIIS